MNSNGSNLIALYSPICYYQRVQQTFLSQKYTGYKGDEGSIGDRGKVGKEGKFSDFVIEPRSICIHGWLFYFASNLGEVGPSGEKGSKGAPGMILTLFLVIHTKI